MPHVITDTCVKDNLCVDVCPAEAIKPLKNDADYASVPQLYINPDECMDCGGCASECPTNSIFPADEVPAAKSAAVAANAAYYKK